MAAWRAMLTPGGDGAGEISPAGCELDVADCNMMVVLAKARPGEWAALEASQQQQQQAAGEEGMTSAGASGEGHGPHVEKLLYELD